jgi:subtilase-type serine protease
MKKLALLVVYTAIIAFTSLQAVAYVPSSSTYRNNQNPAIITAAVNNDEAWVSGLIATGVNVNTRGVGGTTALMQAAFNNNYGMVRSLLTAGADKNAKDGKGYSASDYAVANKNYGMEEYLRGQGVAAVKPTKSYGNLYWIAGAVLIGAVAALALGGKKVTTTTNPGGNNGGQIPTGSVTIPVAALGGSPVTFQTAEYTASTGLSQIGADKAFARGYDGSVFTRAADGSAPTLNATKKVRVAVIDHGTNLTHPDLVANLYNNGATCTAAGCSGTGAWQSGDDTGTQNHGTAVSGIIAGTKNDTGTHGVAYDAQIIPIRALESSQDTAPAFSYAVTNGADIINNSWDYTATIAGSHAASLSQIGSTFGTENRTGGITAAIAANVVFVFAAGNAGYDNVGVMAGLPYYFNGANTSGINSANLDLRNLWLAVVAVDSSNNIAPFSNRCGVAAQWCLAAPGVDLTVNAQTGGTTTMSGTSFAAPMVSGALAVLMGAFPHLTVPQLVGILKATATDLGAAGVDNVYGHGLINLDKATTPGGAFTVATGGGSAALSYSGYVWNGVIDMSGLAKQSLMVLDNYNRDAHINLGSLSQYRKGELLEQKFNSFVYSTPALTQGGTTIGFSSDTGFSRGTIGKAGVNPLAKLYNNQLSYSDNNVAMWTGRSSSNDEITASGVSAKYKGLTFGGVHEDNSLLGTYYSGAFDIGSNDTMFVSFDKSKSYGNWTFAANAFAGMTLAKDRNSSLITKTSDIYTTSFAATGEYKHKGDTWKFSVSQPLYTEKGSFDLLVPTEITSFGNVMTSFKADVSSKNRPVDIELGYSTSISKKTSIRAALLNSITNKYEAIGMMGLEYNF